jgi:hypothetical protein
VPIHVPVKVPVKYPVYVKEYVPNYVKKVIPIEKKVCKVHTNVIDVCKPEIKTCIKKIKVDVPIYKKSYYPVVEKEYVKCPYPVYET